MERLTFDGLFCDIAKCDETPGGTFCETGSCTQRKVWERLKEYEDAEQAGRLVVLDDEKALALAAVVHGCNTNRRLVGASFVQDIHGLYGGPKTISYYQAIEIVQGLLEAEAEAALKGEGHAEAE